MRYDAHMDQAVIDRYRARWIATNDEGIVVADAENLGELLELLDTMPAIRTTVQRVPAADDPMFVGLG